MRKKSNKPFINKFSDKNSIKTCDEQGCINHGEYVAPKSPNSKEKYFFCLEHIKKYNKRWNFFAGKSQTQIYEYQKNDFFEGRPTRPFARGHSSKIKFQFKYSFIKEKINFKKRGFFFTDKKLKIPPKINAALKIFSLKHDFDEKNLKKRYIDLVKKYHPDLNKNLLNKDSKIKEINNAYNILMKHAKENYETT